MTDQTETELKFLLTPEAAERVRGRLMAASEPMSLVSTYVDTPTFALRRAGTTLRLRQTSDGWVQTLKAQGKSAVSRFEDERPAPEGRLDVSLFSKASLKRLGQDRLQDLKPVFETHVTRRRCLLTKDQAEVEAALDEGEIRAGGSVTPILELELELKSGPLKDLFALAREVAVGGGVRLSLVSKSERGYRLAEDGSERAVRFKPPALDFKGPAREAFQILAMEALHQLSANVEHLRDQRSLEAVHQARVALRHLKTYVGAFKDLVSDPDQMTVKVLLNRLIGIFEDARAIDVFQSDVVLPFARHEVGMAELGQAALQAQTRAYDSIQVAVLSEAFSKDLFDLVDWVLCGAWTRNVDNDSDPSLASVSRKILTHRWKAMKRRGRRLDWSDAHARHKLRIQAKKMRYMLEALTRDRKPDGRRFLRRLTRLQDDLGELNDIATSPDVARLVLKGAPNQAAFAAGSLVGARQAQTSWRLKAARRKFQCLRRKAPAEPKP